MANPIEFVKKRIKEIASELELEIEDIKYVPELNIYRCNSNDNETKLYKNGKVIGILEYTNTDYEDSPFFTYKVSKNSKLIGLIFADIITNAEYEEIKHIDGSLYYLRKDDKFALFASEIGKLSELKYTSLGWPITLFERECLIVADERKKYGIIDTNENIIVPFEHNEIFNIHSLFTSEGYELFYFIEKSGYKAGFPCIKYQIYYVSPLASGEGFTCDPLIRRKYDFSKIVSQFSRSRMKFPLFIGMTKLPGNNYEGGWKVPERIEIFDLNDPYAIMQGDCDSIEHEIINTSIIKLQIDGKYGLLDLSDSTRCLLPFIFESIKLITLPKIGVIGLLTKRSEDNEYKIFHLNNLDWSHSIIKENGVEREEFYIPYFLSGKSEDALIAKFKENYLDKFEVK